MITPGQLSALVSAYRKRSVRYNLATYAQIELWRDTGHKCHGRTEDGLAFIVHRSPRNGEMSYSVADSLDDLILSIAVEGSMYGVDLDKLIDPDDCN